ncbi:hypothetical protein MBLNU230_g3325t1 [Neophaeotheca triangularis]
MGEAAGVAYGIETLVEGAIAAAKGIYDPTLPLKATLKPVGGLDLHRAQHTLAIRNGRAYIFGGVTTHGNGHTELADNAMHIVILPSSGVESADYRRIEPTPESPPARFGHSCALIDDRIYMYGGFSASSGGTLKEQGRVWVYDTSTDRWSHLDPPEGSVTPPPRAEHASIASEHPKNEQHRTDEGSLPQQPPDPADVVPEPAGPDTYGTVVVQGGNGAKTGYNDLWSFDVHSRTWAELPEPPEPPALQSENPSLGIVPSLAIVGSRIYSFSAGQMSYLDLAKGAFSDKGGTGELGLVPLGPWSTLPPMSSSLDKSPPAERTEACLLPVTTGQGRNYLLLVGGRTLTGELLDDIWALQLKPDGMTAASFKDAAREAINKNTRESEWDEVKYYSSEGKMIQEGQDGRGLGGRYQFSVAKGSEVDGATVVVWGGRNMAAGEKLFGDGLMITVDR